MRQHGQAVPHIHGLRGNASMEKPKSVVYLNEGQTRVTLIGKWFHMSPDEIEEDYEQRLNAKDSLVTNINNVLCEVSENIASVSSKN